ncbi:GH25 family lysozyme [Bombilactobacillus bombi]|nr:GH25 family lysozyme [Bombilactobacillus bombi]
MTKFAVDVSSYQNASVEYFKNFKDAGVDTAIIKLTQGSADGDAYFNPKAPAQIRAALANNMNVAVYHYFKGNGYADSQNEAKFFLEKIRLMGLDETTVVVADVEDPSLQANHVMADVNAFMQYLISNGYPNVALYSMASWFNAGILNKWTYPLWVASYGSKTCGVTGNVQAWQYTDNWSGENVDMSYDWGLFNKPTIPQQPVIQKSHENVIVTREKVHLYEKFGMQLDQIVEANTAWKANEIIAIQGQPAYLIGKDAYIMQSATDQNGIATVHSYAFTKAPLINKKGDYVRYVNNGEVYKYSNFVKIDDDWCYQVSTNEFLPAIYTIGSGK